MSISYRFNPDGILKGALNVTTNITLTASATTTTFKHANINAQCFIWLSPLTANAAFALDTVYFTNFKLGEVTIHHAASGATDQDFRVLILG